MTAIARSRDGEETLAVVRRRQCMVFDDYVDREVESHCQDQHRAVVDLSGIPDTPSATKVRPAGGVHSPIRYGHAGRLNRMVGERAAARYGHTAGA